MAGKEVPIKGHPLVKRTLDSLTKGAVEPLAMDALASLAGKPELLDAVVDLVQLAWFISEKQGSPGAGRVILGALETVVPQLKDLGKQAERAVDAIRDSSKQLGKAAPAAGVSAGLPSKTAGGVGLRKKR